MVGENIKRYLENKGVTQVFLAEKAKISTGAINQMLNGKRKIIVEEYLALKCLKLIAAYRTRKLDKLPKNRWAEILVRGGTIKS